MNRKGFTLMELMISVSLVSVVMIFTLNLLNDLRAEEALGTNKTADLTNRTIITRIVEDDFYQKGIRQVGVYYGDGSTLNGYCPFTSGVFAADYQFYIRKCAVFFYKDNSCGLIAVGSHEGDDLNYNPNMFMYARKAGTDCANSGGYIAEVWELSSASYAAGGITEDKAQFKRSANTIENVQENALAGNQGNFFFMIKFPAEIPEAYSNTSMSFDLEFSYYTTDTTGFTHGNGEDWYLNYTLLDSRALNPRT